MGRTPAPDRLRSADQVRDTLLGFVDAVAGPDPLLLVGHSAGAYYAQGIAARRPDRVAGLALVCPLLAGVRDVPVHRAVVTSTDLGDDGFRSYFVVQTPEMWDRYSAVVAPAIPLADDAAMERIGERWELTAIEGPAYARPTLIIAGRQDSVVGYAAAADLLADYPQATVAVLDGAGHALPHEQPDLLDGLLGDWLARVERVRSARQPLRIIVDDLSGPQIAAFLQDHITDMLAITPVESKHALDLDALRRPEITFWSALDGDVVVGCGAVKRLDDTHGEIKSMRSDPHRRRVGIGALIVEHILTEARTMGLTRLSLETGAAAPFQPARSLYAKYGFEECDPFADYGPDPHSVFMTRSL